jgi:hypothetical protein
LWNPLTLREPYLGTGEGGGEGGVVSSCTIPVNENIRRTFVIN